MIQNVNMFYIIFETIHRVKSFLNPVQGLICVVKYAFNISDNDVSLNISVSAISIIAKDLILTDYDGCP